LLTVSNLEVVYNDVVLVLRGLSLEVPDGQIVALLGANGAGKTTTLRAVTGLLEVHEGDITKGRSTSTVTTSPTSTPPRGCGRASLRLWRAGGSSPR
jgi:branched-chain amino acid transport system ATP-binding protein